MVPSFPVQHTCIVLYLLYVCDVTALIIQTLENNVKKIIITKTANKCKCFQNNAHFIDSDLLNT